jgi:hypothetical protein
MMPRHWKKLVKLGPGDFFPIRPEIVAETMQHYSIDEAAARKMLAEQHAQCSYYVNDLYQVQVGWCGPGNAMMHLCIRRRDGGMFKDWRHFQQIKNEIAGDEREAIEIYPRESRKVDSSNKWHLWVLPEGESMDGIGWQKRDVNYEENRNIPGMRQRPL